MNRDLVIQTIIEILKPELLQKAYQKDEMANGVQFLGSDTVNKIALGVSCNENFLTTATNWGAQFCVFHHGFDVRTDRSIYPISSQKRLRVIYQNNLTVAAYHYALDAHPQIGNNAQIAQKLEATIVDTLFEEWGFVAELKSEKSIKLLKQECEILFDHPILAVGEPKRQIQRLGIVSGAGKPYSSHIKEMHEKKVDLFITGEPSESVPHKMQEEGIAYFAGGHYATEVFGVQALGVELEKRLDNKVEVKFIDIPNLV